MFKYYDDVSKNVKLRIITMLISSTVYMAVFPFITIYLASVIGKKQTGIIVAFAAISSYFVRILGGYIADIFSKKKIVVLSNLASTIGMLFITISVLNNSKIFLVSGFLIHTIITPISGPAMMSLLIDSSNKDSRKKMTSLTYWASNVSASVGYMIGGFFYSSGKITLMIILTAVSFLNFLIYLFFLEDVKTSINVSKKRNIFTNYKAVFINIPFILSVIGYGLIRVGEDMVTGYGGIRISEIFKPINLLGANITGVKIVSILMVMNAIGVALFTLILERYTSKYNQKLIFTVSVFLYTLGFVGISYSLSFGVLMFAGLLNTIGEMICLPIIASEQIKLMEDDKRSSYISINSFATKEGQLIAGMLISLGDFCLPIVITILLAILFSIGIILLRKTLFSKR